MTKKKNKETPFPTTPKKKIGVERKPSPIMLRVLWGVIIVLLLVPLLKQLNASNTNVNGSTGTAQENPFRLSRWFSSSYQKRAEENLKQTWTYKDQLTKFNNDLDFYFFHKCNVNGFVLGRDNYICSEGYIEAYLGRDYIGEDSILKKIKMVRALQDTLKKRGIDLVMVFAPDKASFFPEYLDSKYNLPRTHTNYADYIKLSKQYGLNYIDMESWFLSMKGLSKYPLFPQYGHHWSFFGGCLAADSLIRYLSGLGNVQYPYFGWKDVQMSATPHGRDDDILQKMNLSFSLPSFPMAYPDVQYDPNPEKNRYKVLGVGDSYYRDFLMNGAMQNVFDEGHYWYYNNKVYPESDRQLLEVWELDFKKEIESSKAIVILGSDGFLTNFGWGFIEDAYKLYTNPKAFYAEKQASYKLNYYKKQIRNNPDKLEELKNQSLVGNISLDSLLNQTAHNMMKDAESKQN